MALVRLPSGEMRNVPVNCTAVIGQVSNIDHENVNLGKAGRKRHMGVRPGEPWYRHEPRDHPTVVARPRTCWSLRSYDSLGKPALVSRLTKHHKRSDKLIVKRAGKERSLRPMGEALKKGPFVQAAL